jgi:prolyl-tRNA editing enzyme YbaK/EbsC (Cys-tRNA(Pro) deacylase)
MALAQLAIGRVPDERGNAEDPKRGAGKTGELDARTVARARAAASEARALKIVACVRRRAAARGRVMMVRGFPFQLTKLRSSECSRSAAKSDDVPLASLGHSSDASAPMSADAAPPAEALASKLASLDAGGSAEASRIPPGPPETSLPDPECDTAKRLDAALVSAGAAKALHWVRVPANYYDEPLAFRAQCVKAPSVEHMCKTICMENTKCTNTDCGDPINSRWYLVVVQYTARLSQQKLEKYLHALNNGPKHPTRKIGKSKFHMRLAKPDDALRLTGYKHGAVAPFATSIPIPTLVSHKIANLQNGGESVLFLGGGEYDLKMGVSLDDLLKGAFHAATVDCTYDDEP